MGSELACREILRRLLGRLNLLEASAQGAELLITERKVGGGEVEHNAWIGRSHAHLRPLANAVRLIALPLELGLKKAGEIRPQDTVLAKGSVDIL
ncbi:hypothetical protein [Synechococcus sp. CBW1107]|uniref:hypothetical protein n=1 Tax=Synechococcus sp. CBW1107 TaxID=2789857 RepID=UPI002AD2CBCF|nr:hypothetical protein [Synechococcus sp. CBW1107]CAK6687338.1 hypothetical protein ICNINCKA_00183 [Synechococcus sp. CBW1107]